MAAAALGPRPLAAHVHRARYLMGTVLEIDAVGWDRAGTEAGVASAFRAVERVEERLSNWKRESELSRANRGASHGSFPLSPETFRSLWAALDLAQETAGAFDPTVGAVTEALGLTGQPPDPDQACQLKDTVGWQKVELDPARRTLFFRSPGTTLDSGGFGKGEALDRAVVALARYGVVAARLNFGGQISLCGAQSPLARRHGFGRVAVAAPDASAEEIYRFRARDGSVSTSGDSERPGHLIDPRTGQAAAFHGSVTVVADTGRRADALSTALFVLGPREGLHFANRRGIAALFIARSGSRYEMQASRAFPRPAQIPF